MDESTRERTLKTELPNGIDSDIARDAEAYEPDLDLPPDAAYAAARDVHGGSQKPTSDEVGSARAALERETESGKR